MIVKHLCLLSVLALSGCATFGPIEDLLSFEEGSTEAEETVNYQVVQNLEEGTTLSSSVNFQKQFNHKFKQHTQSVSDKKIVEAEKKHHTKDTLSNKENINYYVRGLMQDLVANLQYVNSTTPVAIVSFVMLDSNYNDSNLLGVQIAESLMHEVHKFGIPVIDFKTTGYIRITEQGDFAFSKDYQDFSGEMPARYIVGGTMLKHTDGYLINARIVGIKSQAVVSSAQMFIPNGVSDPILNMTSDSYIPEQQNLLKVGSIKTTEDSPLAKNVLLIQE